MVTVSISRSISYLLCVVLLAEVHDDLVPLELAKRLFGMDVVRLFSKKYPSLRLQNGFLGNGNRAKAVKRRVISLRKLEKACELAAFFRYVPWVRCAGVSGSISYGNAVEDDDIDVTLVVSDHRLWLTRLFEQVLFRLLRVRRGYSDRNLTDKICVNLYVSEGFSDVRISMDGDILTALELAVLKPVYREALFQRFLGNNRWIRSFFPALKIGDSNSPPVNNRISSARIPLVSTIVDIADYVAMWTQIAYMKILRHHPDKSVLSSHTIHFFPNDQWEIRRTRLRERLQLYDVRGIENILRKIDK